MCIFTITRWDGRSGNNLLVILSVLILGENIAKFDFCHHHLFSIQDPSTKQDISYCECSNVRNFDRWLGVRKRTIYGLTTLKSYYTKYITIPMGQNVNVSPYDIAIHIRAGDIMGKYHRKYTQPPLYFYKTLIHKNISKRIIIVFEKNNNPVIKELMKMYSSYENICFQSSTLINDIHTLSNCKQLVISQGTFWIIPYFISNTIENIIIADYMKNDCWFYFDSDVLHNEIELPDYMNMQNVKSLNEIKKNMINYKPLWCSDPESEPEVSETKPAEQEPPVSEPELSEPELPETETKPAEQEPPEPASELRTYQVSQEPIHPTFITPPITQARVRARRLNIPLKEARKRYRIPLIFL